MGKSQTSPALVSIIMPVYNGESFVDAAIGSVLQQSYRYWELIVVNDGSRDGTATCLEKYSDPRIRIYHQQNRGVSAARNVGLREMKGDFFSFLDADDMLPAHSLEDRLAVFADEKIQFVDGKVKIFDTAMHDVLQEWVPSYQGEPFDKLVRIDDKVFFGPSWMIRRKPEVRYQMEESLTHCEDLFFYITIAQQGLYSHTPACTLHYRKNSGSAMSDLDGLARGYTLFRRRVVETFGDSISMMTRVILFYKTRKIMFLSFAAAGKYLKAFQYMFTGKV